MPVSDEIIIFADMKQSVAHSRSRDCGSDAVAVREARRVTWTGFWSNVALSALKIVAGILGRSSAMVADGIHSASDLVTDVVVLAVIGVSRRKENSRYTYGHGKYETFATLVIATLLGVVGIAMFYDGLCGCISALRGGLPARPGWIALVMAVVSIAVKEWLFRYTRSAGRRIASGALEANAWHHRSDALSSLATLAGIAGAMFLGSHWRVLDPLAAMVVSVFIVLMAVRLALPSARELLEVSLPAALTGEMERIVSGTPGVIAYHHFRSRRNGSRLIADMHIKVAPDITVDRGHEIATAVEQRLHARYGDILTNIHVEPYRGEIRCVDGRVAD